MKMYVMLLVRGGSFVAGEILMCSQSAGSTRHITALRSLLVSVSVSLSVCLSVCVCLCLFLYTVCLSVNHVAHRQGAAFPESALTTRPVIRKLIGQQFNVVRPKLHYTDTGYGRHQRTSSQQFYNKFATSRHVKMLGCGKFLSVGGDFVVQQLVELL